jgi:hypothetical protein
MMELSLFVCSLLLYSMVFAQDHYFLDETSTRLPFTNKLCGSADGADIDGDGDIDILASVDQVVPPFIPCYLFINNGSGYFTQENMTRLPDTSVAFYGVEFGDVDADGDYDAYLVSQHDQDLLYINNGFGYYSDETYRLPSFISTNNYFVFGDFSNNLQWDIIFICYWSGLNRFLLNDGNGYFNDVTDIRMPDDSWQDVFGAITDIDNDLDLDLILSWVGGQEWRHIRGLENVEGYFINFDQGRMEDAHARWIDTADIDSDGDLDVIFSGVADRGVLINYNGYFVNESDPRIPQLGPEYGGSNGAGLGDYDNDGDIDIYMGFSVDRLDHLYLNDGNGYFTLADERIPNIEASTQWVEPFDADDDGDLDLFLGCSGDLIQRIFINYSTPDTIPPTILAQDLPVGLIDSASEYWFKLSTYDNITVEKGKLDVKLVYRLDGSEFDTLSFRHCGGTIFKETLSDLSVGSLTEYYVYIRDRMGNATFIPEGAPDSLYSFTVAPTTGIFSDNPLLPEMRLIVYPNPSNSTFKISYYLTAGEDAEISIYNLTGQQLCATHLSQGTPAGWHTWSWGGWKDLPSGIYIIQFEGNSGREVRKAVMIH